MTLNDENEYEIGFLLADPIDRCLAALIDGIFILLLSATGIGIIFGIIYFLIKDCIPFFDGQSIGKKIMKIKVIDEGSNETIENLYDKGLIRNTALLLPIFQIIDALMVFSSNRKRYGDQWAKTMVVKDI